MAVPQQIRIGIVGIGTHFKEILLPALLAQDNLIISAFCDSAEEARQWASSRFPHTKVVADFMDDRFWGEIDCVVCASFAKVHQAILQQAINHHKHCFCEKPVKEDLLGFHHVELYPRSMTYKGLLKKLRAQGVDIVLKERPHHTTHDIFSPSDFIIRLTDKPLIQKIIREEMQQ